MRRVILNVLITSILLFSCRVEYDIYVKSDQSATINYHFQLEPGSKTNGGDQISVETDSIANNDSLRLMIYDFYNYEYVSNLNVRLTNDLFQISYNLKDINCLGEILDPFRLTYSHFKFEMSENKLVISKKLNCNSIKEDDDITEAFHMITFRFVLRFEKKIKNMESKFPGIVQMSKTEIQLNSSLGEIYAFESDTLLLVDIKN